MTKSTKMYQAYTEYTQKNGAVSIVFTIQTAPFFFVYLYNCNHVLRDLTLLNLAAEITTT